MGSGKRGAGSRRGEHLPRSTETVSAQHPVRLKPLLIPEGLTVWWIATAIVSLAVPRDAYHSENTTLA